MGYIEEDQSRSFNNWKGPKWESPFRSSDAWLKSRRSENEDEKLWRVHDKLYDLSEFAAVHPGGEQWIALTRGTDITETFEAHHLSSKPRAVMTKYFVKDANTPRNSPFTFKKDEFYCKLKDKVVAALKDVKSGPSSESKLFADIFLITTLLLSSMAAAKGSYIFAFGSGVILCFTTIIAHNFFHQRNTFRMYYFAVCGLSVKDWRISHGLSHHIFPNSRQDLEITLFEPLLQWTPRADKSILIRFVSWIYSPLVYCGLFHYQWISRLLFTPEGVLELIPLALPVSMMVLGGVSVLSALFWWNVIVVASSFTFGCIGLNAAHHHPDILHDGDEPRNEKEMDWGIYQIDAVRDRVEIYGIFPLVIILFGDHTLHHLFPTIDHFHLNRLYPLLEETCVEFGIDFQVSSILDLIRGQFLQLARNYTISHKSK